MEIYDFSHYLTWDILDAELAEVTSKALAP